MHSTAAVWKSSTGIYSCFFCVNRKVMNMAVTFINKKIRLIFTIPNHIYNKCHAATIKMCAWLDVHVTTGTLVLITQNTLQSRLMGE